MVARARATRNARIVKVELAWDPLIIRISEVTAAQPTGALKAMGRPTQNTCASNKLTSPQSIVPGGAGGPGRNAESGRTTYCITA